MDRRYNQELDMFNTNLTYYNDYINEEADANINEEPSSLQDF